MIIIKRYISIKTHAEDTCEGDSNEYSQHTRLWNTGENYLLIFIKYLPYLASAESTELEKALAQLKKFHFTIPFT